MELKSMITTLENNFTQSEICCKQSCTRKWYYTYVRLLKSRGAVNWNFIVGNEVHRFMEDYYRGNKVSYQFEPVIDCDVIRDQKFEENFAFWQTVFPALIGSYLSMYPNDTDRYLITDVEILIKRNYRDLNFSGKKDVGGLIKSTGSNFMMDHKTTSRIDILNPLMLHQKFQFLFYCWLEQKEATFIVNQIKKPALRQTKTESAAAFAQRCANDYFVKPQQYFKRIEASFKEEEINRFQSRILDPICDELIAILNSGGDPDFEMLWKKRNLDACYNYNTPCQFLDLCFDEDDDENENLINVNYDQKTSKHEELETAN